MFSLKCRVVPLMLLLFSNNVLAHEKGAPFSGAIIDPLRVHHAHIEDEQRINFSYVDGIGNVDDDGYSHSVELAVNWDSEFRWGSEIFIPYLNTGGAGSGMGDIRAQLVKYAFINEPETILTGIFGVSLPTGDEEKGLGTDNTAIEAALFVDRAYKNWYWGLNMELGTVVSGEDESELELATGVSYSFIDETVDFAPAKPGQDYVPSVSLELVSESILSGAEEGADFLTVIPGVHIWHPASDWSLRFGVEVPLGSDKENDRIYLLQIGAHKDWRQLMN